MHGRAERHLHRARECRSRHARQSRPAAPFRRHRKESAASMSIRRPMASKPQLLRYERVEILQPTDPQANGSTAILWLAPPSAHQHARRGHHLPRPGRLTWLYEPATGLILQTLAIPRGQIAIAAGHAAPDARKLSVRAERGQTEYGICSTAFLEAAFRTDSYQLDVEFHADGSWSYVSDTMLMLHGRNEPFGTATTTEVGQGRGGRSQPLAKTSATARQRRSPGTVQPSKRRMLSRSTRFSGLQPQSPAAAARPAHDRLALQPIRQRQVQMAPDLKMSAMDSRRFATCRQAR